MHHRHAQAHNVFLYLTMENCVSESKRISHWYISIEKIRFEIVFHCFHLVFHSSFPFSFVIFFHWICSVYVRSVILFLISILCVLLLLMLCPFLAKELPFAYFPSKQFSIFPCFFSSFFFAVIRYSVASHSRRSFIHKASFCTNSIHIPIWWNCFFAVEWNANDENRFRSDMKSTQNPIRNEVATKSNGKMFENKNRRSEMKTINAEEMIDRTRKVFIVDCLFACTDVDGFERSIDNIIVALVNFCRRRWWWDIAFHFLIEWTVMNFIKIAAFSCVVLSVISCDKPHSRQRKWKTIPI